MPTHRALRLPVPPRMQAYRWNVKRKWRQSNKYNAIGGEEDEEEYQREMEEAYLDELEQQVSGREGGALSLQFGER